MKGHTLYYILTLSLVLLTASCGQQHQAKTVVQQFVDQHIDPAANPSSITIERFDSTRVLADSVIARMRQNADTISRYTNKPFSFANVAEAGKLYSVRIRYTIAGQEYSDTYYLDEQLGSVVAFKSN